MLHEGKFKQPVTYVTEWALKKDEHDCATFIKT
jgi:hypothetical protein